MLKKTRSIHRAGKRQPAPESAELVEEQVSLVVVHDAREWHVGQIGVVKVQPLAVRLAHVGGVVAGGGRAAEVVHNGDELVVCAAAMPRVRAALRHPRRLHPVRSPGDLRQLHCVLLAEV
jgi:hypothetical protein